MAFHRLMHRRFWVLVASTLIGASALALGTVELAESRPATSPPAGDGYGRSIHGIGQAVPVTRARYKTLLRKIEVANDQQSYGDFYDYGYYTGTSYMEHTDLPTGYWVYVAPHWLIYKEDLNNPQPQPPAAWGPEQSTGAPNTPEAGDINTAWASATADGQREWLELTYESPVEAVGVMVYETHNPGAVDCVIAYAGDEQVQVWAGKDPTEPGKPMGVSVMGFSTPVTTNRIRLNIDSPRVSGWNEIDAVGLIDKQGKVHWAVNAAASSTWASRGETTDLLGIVVETPDAASPSVPEPPALAPGGELKLKSGLRKQP